MALLRGKLTTIYSVGEGRTIVFATDGCQTCLAAFSILVETAAGNNNTPPSDFLGSGSQFVPRQPGFGRYDSKFGPKSPPGPGRNASGFSEKKPQRRRTPQLNLGELETVLEVSGHGTPNGESSRGGGTGATQAQGFNRKPTSLLILDPEMADDESAEQDLTLRSSDRLILALYTPPQQVHLPQSANDGQHSEPGSGGKGLLSRGDPFLSLSGLLGRKKPGHTGKSPKSPKSPKTPEQKGQFSHGYNPADDPLGLGPKKEDPKVGPGRTSIFMPTMQLEEVDRTLDKWHTPKDKDCLLKFVLSARDAKVRFEAIKLDERHSPKGDNEGPWVSHATGSHERSHTTGRKHITGIGSSLSQFCDGVEAGILILSCLHSCPALDLAPQSFPQQLVEYCSHHCSCNVRIISSDQIREDAEDSPPASGGGKTGLRSTSFS